MDREIIMRDVIEAMVEEFELNPEDMKPEAHLYDDLGLDSLDAVDMVIVLENTFGLRIRDDQAIRDIRTLEDIYGFIERKGLEAREQP
jgi:acyl carrier protein